jgi:hypothetical protein
LDATAEQQLLVDAVEALELVAAIFLEPRPVQSWRLALPAEAMGFLERFRIVGGIASTSITCSMR